MSFRALAAIQDVDAPNVAVVALLYTLAQYADEDGRCYPSRAALMEGTKLSPGGLRNAIVAAVDAGLIAVEERTRKDGGRSSNLYSLLFCQKPAKGQNMPSGSAASEGEPEGGTPLSPDDRGGCHHVIGALSPGDRAFLNLSAEPVGADAPNPGAGASPNDDPVEAAYQLVLGEWPQAGLDHTDVPQGRELWGKACAEVGDQRRLVGAARAFLAERGRQKHDYAPPGVHTWLKRGSWRHRLPTAVESGAPKPMFAGPPELRGELVAALGEDFAATYVDRAAWRSEPAAIVAATGTAFERLKAPAVLKILRNHGVALAPPQSPVRAGS